MGRIWNKVKEVPEKMGKLYPPGYEYKSEISGKYALLGLGLVVSFQFFGKLYHAYKSLFDYIYYSGKTVEEYRLIPGVVAKPFVELVKGYFWWYLPWLIALVLSIFLHYLHYYRGTKSIYVMRRIRNPYVVFKSCVMGPLVQLMLGGIIIVVWYFLYYGIYLLVMPQVCNPRFM